MHGPWHTPEHPDEGDYSAEERVAEEAEMAERNEAHARPPTVEDCAWGEGEFGFFDEPGEHDPCYVVMPGGACIAFNHSATPGVDVARARWVQSACNAALSSETQPIISSEASSGSLPPDEQNPSQERAAVVPAAERAGGWTDPHNDWDEDDSWIHDADMESR